MDALLQSQRKKGRKGDTEIGHLTPAEIVIPRAFAEDDNFRAMLTLFFKENNADLREFIVGSGKNKTNPKTHYMEFGFFSKITRPFKKIWKEAKRVEKDIFGDILKEKKRTERHVEGAVKSVVSPEMPSFTVPELPPASPTTVGLSERAGGTGRRRKRRTRKRYTTPGFMAPAMVGRRGLKTTFG